MAETTGAAEVVEDAAVEEDSSSPVDNSNPVTILGEPPTGVPATLTFLPVMVSAPCISAGDEDLSFVPHPPPVHGKTSLLQDLIETVTSLAPLK